MQVLLAAIGCCTFRDSGVMVLKATWATVIDEKASMYYAP